MHSPSFLSERSVSMTIRREVFFAFFEKFPYYKKKLPQVRQFPSLSSNFIRIIFEVLIKLFQKFAGSRGSAPCRAPQSTEFPYLRSKALKMGAWGKENKSFPSPIIQSFIPL